MSCILRFWIQDLQTPSKIIILPDFYLLRSWTYILPKTSSKLSKPFIFPKNKSYFCGILPTQWFINFQNRINNLSFIICWLELGQSKISGLDGIVELIIRKQHSFVYMFLYKKLVEDTCLRNRLYVCHNKEDPLGIFWHKYDQNYDFNTKLKLF